jgi:hypothetical protein
MLLAVVPDTVSQAGHMAGVSLFGLGGLGLAYDDPVTRTNVILCLVAYVLRVVAKVVVVARWNLNWYFLIDWYFKDSFLTAAWYDPPPLSSFLYHGEIVSRAIYKTSIAIMFGEGEAHPNVILVFRICAVAQWGILLVLAHTLLTRGYKSR